MGSIVLKSCSKGLIWLCHELLSLFCDIQVDDDPVPEGTTVLCTVKAEKTQYPHGSRQDCWAIVSVKASRIEKRQHVDIVAVIDSSGSMAGMKTQLVKETLIRLIDLCELLRE